MDVPNREGSLRERFQLHRLSPDVEMKYYCCVFTFCSPLTPLRCVVLNSLGLFCKSSQQSCTACAQEGHWVNFDRSVQMACVAVWIIVAGSGRASICAIELG
eukprot:2176799-Amphidinium_carterae.1